nr:unnamed protein product [Callosobruchus analis]
MEDLKKSEDVADSIERNTAYLKSCPKNASMQGLGEYKTLKDMTVETSLDVDRIMDDEMDKYMDDEEEDEAESERPGTTNFDMLIEGQTLEHFVNQCNGFYEEMKLKVSSLRSTPVVKNLIVKPKKNLDEDNMFENMRHTPDIQKRLDAITKLDDDIHDIISTYKVERAARMEAQLEMCNELSQNPDCRERDSEKFLQLCQFELSQLDSDEEDDKNNENLDKGQRKAKSDGKFVKRNAQLAKEGYLAGCSLTDEEKSKIEEIMSAIDLESDKEKNKSPFTITEKEESEQAYTNAYTFDDQQSRRMKDIDTELEKFALDEKNTEKKYVSGLPKSYEETGSICLLKKEIANIDAKLKELRNRDGEEMEKNRQRLIKLQKEHDEQEEKDLNGEGVDQLCQTREANCETKVDDSEETKEELANAVKGGDSIKADEAS